MNAWWMEIIILMPLAILIVQDFKTRSVNLLWLIVFAILSVIVSLIANGVLVTFANIGSNLCLLLYMSIGILTYIRIRRHKWLNPLNEYIGSGDVIFLLAITPLHSVRYYLLFMMCAFALSLLWLLAVKLIYRKDQTIPLVGTMGSVLGIIMIIKNLL